MHKQFRALLPNAGGESRPVIALNIDVRGFSQFSVEVESFDTALYIRRIYERILDDYFPYVDFFKPTGDGLLMVLELDETDSDDLEVKAKNVVETSLRLMNDFSSLLDDDPWIYYSVPTKVGIGIARGSASRLRTDELILDYSGNPLNVASRLMDLARPQGVVIDKTFPVQLLSPELRDKFTSDSNVYIRSVAEKIPTTVYYTSDATEIPPGNRRRIDEIAWLQIREEMKLRSLLDSSTFLFDLKKEPLDPKQIFVAVDYPAVGKSGRRIPDVVRELRVPLDDITYRNDAGQPRVVLPYFKIGEQLKDKGVKPDWTVKVLIKYPT